VATYEYNEVFYIHEMAPAVSFTSAWCSHWQCYCSAKGTEATLHRPI